MFCVFITFSIEDSLLFDVFARAIQSNESRQECINTHEVPVQ